MTVESSFDGCYEGIAEDVMPVDIDRSSGVWCVQALCMGRRVLRRVLAGCGQRMWMRMRREKQVISLHGILYLRLYLAELRVKQLLGTDICLKYV